MAGVEGASRRSKLTKVMNGSGNVSTMGVDFLSETSQVNRFVVDRYRSSPVSVFLVPVDTFVITTATDAFCLIRAVLPLSAWPEIVPRVVKTISVSMVVSFAFLQSSSLCNLPMHINLSGIDTAPNTPNSAPTATFRSCYFVGAPFETGDEVKIACANDSVFALSKWNPSSTFFHVSYSVGRFCLIDEPARRSKFNQN